MSMRGSNVPVDDVGSPNLAIVGWIESGTKKDAVEYAKSFAKKHFSSPEISWFAALPLLGGWLYEVHEGGPGKSYLPGIARAMAEGRERAWFRVGTKAFSVSMRDGRPLCVQLSSADSQKLFDTGIGRIQPRGNMERVIRRGTGTLVVGSTIFVTGLLFMFSVMAWSAAYQQMAPAERRVDAELLPHKAWSLVEKVPPTLFVDSLKIGPGAPRWQTSIKPIQRSGSGQPSQAPAADQAGDAGPNPVEPSEVVQ